MEEDKNIERFTEEVLNEIGLEKTSASFVDNVMAAVEQHREVEPIYNSLISSKAWAFVVIFFAGLLAFVFTFPIKTPLLDKLGISINTSIDFNFFKGISFSNPFVYGISIFGILVLIQIYILKNNFDKQIGAL